MTASGATASGATASGATASGTTTPGTTASTIDSVPTTTLGQDMMQLLMQEPTTLDKLIGAGYEAPMAIDLSNKKLIDSNISVVSQTISSGQMALYDKLKIMKINYISSNGTIFTKNTTLGSIESKWIIYDTN